MRVEVRGKSPLRSTLPPGWDDQWRFKVRMGYGTCSNSLAPDQGVWCEWVLRLCPSGEAYNEVVRLWIISVGSVKRRCGKMRKGVVLGLANREWDERAW
jgi:hypothetical protein